MEKAVYMGDMARETSKPKTGRKIRHDRSGIIVEAVAAVLVTAFMLICLIPFIYVIAGSFTEESMMARGVIEFNPAKWVTSAYKVVLEGSQIKISYAVSIGITVFGTLFSLIFTAFFAYPLASGRLKYAPALNFYIYFTMIFSGGLVPTYLWYTQGLKLSNTYAVLILPMLLQPWNMFLMRNFFASIPSSLAESARIDGASESRILFDIILPCSKPALATVGTFYALGYWNEWYKVMLYNSGDKTKWTLQFLIMKLMREADTIRQMAANGVSTVGADFPSTTIKLATAVLTIGPIILVYPFAQKYFTSGIMVGSVKG